MAIILLVGGSAMAAGASASGKMVVVIDAGHGGKDHGALDNGAKEKDINLAVALRLGELCKNKLKNTEVVFTRDDDTFVSLQGRADIANKAKGDLFISIHTNSVDAKNKNRTTVAGASVYTQGPHKDEANLGVARRENSVIELENGYEQKYSGFDPSKDESYIIFEMAQKKNLAESARFAKDVQQNLVKIAGRRDRGVHQAGFWVLWSTSMPSVLIELDFICNPQSAKFMTSKEGVDKLAEAIFEGVKTYEESFLAKRKAIAAASSSKGEEKRNAPEPKNTKNIGSNATSSGSAAAKKAAKKEADKKKLAEEKAKKAAEKKSIKKNKRKKKSDATAAVKAPAATKKVNTEEADYALAYTPEPEEKDLSHSLLKATKEMRRPRTTADGRRRRSLRAKALSDQRNLTVNHIEVKREITSTRNLASENKPSALIN